MKERILYEDEFERQLKEKADQFKMYPSDNVWKNVYASSRIRRRRFVIGMSFLIGGILTLAGSQLLFPSKNIQSASVRARVSVPAAATSADAPARYNDRGYARESLKVANGAGTPAPVQASAPFLTDVTASPSEDHPAQPIAGIPERIQNTQTEKTIQPSVVNIVVKSTMPLALTVKESVATAADRRMLNKLPSELTPESSSSPVTHIHDERFSWEIYITPTLNTHYLNGMNFQALAQSIQSSPIRVVHFANVNGFVDNTPALGYDVGGNILYRVSKNISLKAGLDFSFTRYYIKTYDSRFSASSVMSSYLGYVADSLATSSSGGVALNKNPQHDQNRYYRLSIPIGVEMKVAGSGRVQLHIGATIQPSYLLNTSAYSLSDDYSRYIKNPDVLRRLNLNAGAEAFISYGVGKLRWEIGPQMRYQIFSTYKNSYPLRENMLNYGIRFGITKTIR